MSKEEAKREVGRLVERLRGLSPADFKRYDEENTKKDFILPLFRALGWATEDRQEVTAEDKVSRRRVDYAFRIDGIPKFFLEAKPLRADLDKNLKYAWQAISYAWTKGVTWAVLTDFEGLRIFNAEFIGSSLQHNIVKDISYQEYLARFDELWLLSREACQQNLLDAEAEKVEKKAKPKLVDKELFEKLIEWRQKMHRQLRQYNKKYSSRQIDEAVQRILDRLIFVRTAEDRELEPPTLIASVREWRENGHRKDLDVALKGTFREFDQKYDSELFEPHFSEDLTYDSTSYAQIIEGLYGMRDEVPSYLFDAIDADVMGGIYEQYLSFTQGEVELEEKRARRKKMGIYYTPQFVVKYIVENTVGRLLKEKSHEEIRNLRILDPACGSGSFLIEAFDRLGRYHREIRGEPRKGVGAGPVPARPLREATGASPTRYDHDEMVDFLERVRILKDNIYGVDLDPQAVEIARLNLLLKTLNQRALLPKLENNIRTGNSLISGLPVELSQYFGTDYEAKRPFNWEAEFDRVMKEDGFDVVIGNPPWGADFDEEDKAYLDRHYSLNIGKYESYIYFIERATSILRPGGYFGFIVPSYWASRSQTEALRQYLFGTMTPTAFVVLPENVFHGVKMNSCIFIARKALPAHLPDLTISVAEIPQSQFSPDFSPEDLKNQVVQVNVRQWLERPYLRFNPRVSYSDGNILSKIENNSIQLGNICEISQGLTLYRRTTLAKLYGKKKAEEIVSKRLFHANRKKNKTYKKELLGRDVSRYRVEWNGKGWVSYGPWLAHAVDERFFRGPRLAVQKIRNPILKQRLVAGYLDDNETYSAGVLLNVISRPQSSYSILYTLGLMNSALLNFWYRKSILDVSIRVIDLQKLPIRRIDFGNPSDVKLHNRIVELVEEMLELHKRLKDAVGEEKKDLERQIARTDKQIDDLVYELYGITEEERKMIDGKK